MRSDKTVLLWDVQTGKKVRIFQGHTSYITSLAISPSGRYAASGCAFLRRWAGSARGGR